MKHRSIGVFILLAATLAAAPQASQELSALKDSVVGRVRSELLQAVLNLRGSGGVQRFAPRPARLDEVSCEASKELAARKGQPNAKSARRDALPKSEDAPRPEDRDDSAMIIDPNSPMPGPVAVASVELDQADVVLGKATELIEEKITAGDLAMIIQPTEDIMRVAGGRRPSPRLLRNTEADARTQFVAAPDAKGGMEFLLMNEEARREFDKAMREAAESRGAGEAERVKVLKVKRLGRYLAGSAGKAAPQPRKAPAAPLWPDTDERHTFPAGE